jgi:PAS domain S-box-containing protein
MRAKSILLLIFVICIFILINKSEYAIAIIFITVIWLLVFNIFKLRRTRDLLQKNVENLRENYDFLRILLDTIPNPIFSKNVEGEYIECNTAFEQYLGLTKEQIIGKTVYEINQEAVAEIPGKTDFELMQSRGKQTYESKVRYADATEHDVLFNTATLIAKDNRVQGLVGVMLDITERKMFEKKISKLLHLNQAMLEVSQSITVLNNMNELFGLILEKAIGII